MSVRYQMNYEMLPSAVSGVEVCLCELSCAGSHQKFQLCYGFSVTLSSIFLPILGPIYQL